MSITFTGLKPETFEPDVLSFDDDFWQEVESIFDKIGSPDKIVQVSELYLNLKLDTQGDWIVSLKSEILLALSTYLKESILTIKDKNINFENKEINHPPSLELRSLGYQDTEDFLHYLLHGFYPLSSDITRFTHQYFVNGFILIVREERERMKGFMIRHKQFAIRLSSRLAWQFPFELTSEILHLLDAELSNAAWRVFNTGINYCIKHGNTSDFNNQLRREFIRMILQEVISGLSTSGKIGYSARMKVAVSVWNMMNVQFALGIPLMFNDVSGKSELITNDIRAIIPFKTDSEGVLSADRPQLDGSEHIQSNGNPIENLSYSQDEASLLLAAAGAVLLYPAMVDFFREQGLVNQRLVFEDEPSRQKAVHWWILAATGVQLSAESDATIAKILCGLPLSEPLCTAPTWSTAEFDMAAELAERCAREWLSPLRGSDAYTVRRCFLMRTGFASFKSNEWFIQVDEDAKDILLPRCVTYSVSLIYLPWIKSVIHVKWF